MTRKGFEHRGFTDNARCRRCLLLVGAIAALLLTMPAASASRGDRLGHAADAVVDAGIPGVVVYGRDKGRTTVVTRGYDDVAAKRPMSVEDRFRVGSVTKSFVATIVLQLVAEGKLSLGDSVEKWLPGLCRTAARSPFASCSRTGAACSTTSATSKCWRLISRGISTTFGRRFRSSGWRPNTSRCSRRARLESRATRTPVTSSSAW